MLFVSVAENIIVYFSFGKYPIIALSAPKNPISSITSASSRTRIFKLFASKPGLSSRCCNNLPGVQMTTFIPDTRSFSYWQFLPPMSRPTELMWNYPIELNTSNTCIASSLVGRMIIAPNPSKGVHLSIQSCSTRGTKYPRVFPLPVFEAPKMSLPARA